MDPLKKPPLTHKERIAAIQAVRQWIPLIKCYPTPGQHVFVKMDDGLIEIAHWDSARAAWTHSPFERWGHPESWAPVVALDMPQPPATPANPFEHLPISGTAPSRVRPEPGPALFPFKFLSSFLQ